METALAAAYERCRDLHRRYGRTYYLATQLLPARKRRHVYALYAFTRFADEIVDGMQEQPLGEREARLREWSARFRRGLDGAPVQDPILPAVLDTIRLHNLDRDDFDAFLRSMAMDIDTFTYPTYADLLGYMEGSAAVIGTMMLPILGTADPGHAREPARQLGFAFQLTNFIRDVGEDLERGRIYLPLEDLHQFGVSPADLEQAARERQITPAIRQLIRFEIARAREHYALAAPGIPMLAPTSHACIRTAFHLYAAILDQIEKQEHNVFLKRATVSTTRRLRVAARCLLTTPGTSVTPPVAADRT